MIFNNKSLLFLSSFFLSSFTYAIDLDENGQISTAVSESQANSSAVVTALILIAMVGLGVAAFLTFMRRF